MRHRCPLRGYRDENQNRHAGRNGSMSTVNQDGAASADNAPKLDVRCELDRIEPPAIPPQAPRRAAKRRIAAIVAALLAALVLGWAAALKTHDQAVPWLQETAAALQWHLETQGKRIVAGIEALVGPSASPESTSRGRLADEVATA